ncbi:MAG TPA: hypothetical protein VK447_09380 [Myxococcaceae bacterium]|nr:hypothetical protein [Myxococcaceae bacterium]
MSARPLLSLGALALLVLSPAAEGAAVPHRSFEEMTAQAPLVVRATVTASQARKVGTRIYTFTDLRPTEALKGKAPATLVVRQPGGEVGSIGQRVAGAARFTVGEEVVLFLEPAKDDAAVQLVSGMAAGKVRLEQRGGQTRAVRSLEGLSLRQPSGAPVVRPVGDREELGEASAFLERIRRAARAAGGKR